MHRRLDHRWERVSRRIFPTIAKGGIAIAPHTATQLPKPSPEGVALTSALALPFHTVGLYHVRYQGCRNVVSKVTVLLQNGQTYYTASNFEKQARHSPGAEEDPTRSKEPGNFGPGGSGESEKKIYHSDRQQKGSTEAEGGGGMGMTEVSGYLAWLGGATVVVRVSGFGEGEKWV